MSGQSRPALRSAATKRARLGAATGSMILLASLDRYVFELGAQP